jgi:putative thioredoxin
MTDQQPSAQPVGAERFAGSTVPDLQAPGPSGPPSPGGAPVPGVVVDVADADFPELVERSKTIPVVIDLWATWCQPCRQLSPVLERLAESHAGAFLLAKVDVDAAPQVAQAFGVQSVPAVVALLAGQPVPLFTGALPEAEVRQVLAKVLELAAANGITGRVAGAGSPEDGEAGPPPLPPLHQEAHNAVERGDLEAAASAFAKALAENPADDDAKAGLAQVALLSRVEAADPDAALAAAEADPRDIDAALAAADAEIASGSPEAAFGRLLALVRTTAGDDRDRLRLRLLDYFEVTGAGDPRVTAARRALASALF